jgi:serine/threonine-protein kinase
MAPERFKRDGVADARTDIYALTCVLHEALTGQQPFPADAIEKIAVAHMLEPPPQPSELRAGIPAAMDDVIATGMAKDPEQRYATINDLARAARAALNTSSAGRAEPSPPPTQPTESPRPPIQPETAIAPEATSPPADTAGRTEERSGVQPPTQVATQESPAGVENRPAALVPPTQAAPIFDGVPFVRRASRRKTLVAAAGVAIVVVAVAAGAILLSGPKTA